MVLLRRVIGDALRARRQFQHRTLREVSTSANVSLGYLSEIERGQKEASSECLAAICAALRVPLSEVFAQVSGEIAREEAAAAGLPALGRAAEPVGANVTDFAA
jgi:transcriptional regulator with XRE-family HTH domain